MLLGNIKIGTKIFGGFIVVVLLFTGICSYMVLNFFRLADLQDQGAQRADDAIRISQISREVSEIYPVFADAIINRNFTETRSSLESIKAQKNEHIQTVEELVDTEEERAAAAEFAEQYERFVGLFDNELFPLLEQSDTVSKRTRDALLLERTVTEVEQVYTLMADAIINRNLQQANTEIDELQNRLNERSANIESIVDTAQESASLADFTTAIAAYFSLFEQQLAPALRADSPMSRIRVIDARVDAARNEALAAIRTIQQSIAAEADQALADERQVRDYDGRLDQLRDATIAPLNSITAALEQEMTDSDAAFDQVMERTIYIAAGLSLLGIILALGFALVLTTIIKRPLLQAVGIANQIAKGDLSMEIGQTSRDETGQLLQSLKAMTEHLNNVLADIQSAAQYVSTGSEELSSTSQELSQGSTEQAASGEEVSSSIQQMRSNIQQSADNARETESISQQAANDAEQSGTVVKEAVQAMQEISEKISIIEEITRQTNMLSLNASIEAARAGEHGKGFAVVASEVGKLAARSKGAAGEISELSAKTAEVASEASRKIEDLVPSIRNTADLVQEVSAASREQLSGVQQISQAMEQLDQVIQKNASSSEEVASTAEELASQAEELQSSIAFFTVKQYDYQTNLIGKESKEKDQT